MTKMAFAFIMCKVKMLYSKSGCLMDLKERMYISDLYEEYGSLLTDKQKDSIELYCLLDLSLFEIAEKQGISRQAVKCAIAHAIDSLKEYESKLGVVEFKSKLRQILDSDISDASKLQRLSDLTEE